ncbi:hypothetical protein [Streptomyces sp. NPDC046862]|uniref:hypothetical protein n=1 Tax=Streptomyces sp. NPDC046862 TaxID=3154603 RepID=UPI0034554A5C
MGISSGRAQDDMIDRGVRDKVLGDDLRGDAMFSAVVERALWLTIDDAMPPEDTTEAAVAIFLNGARRPERP